MVNAQTSPAGDTSRQSVGQPALLRRAGVAIRMCFEPATREMLENYVEELGEEDLEKLARAASYLEGTVMHALGRRHS